MKNYNFNSLFMGVDSYKSPEYKPNILYKTFPNVATYIRMIVGPIVKLAFSAQVGKCDAAAWVGASTGVLRVLEKAGCKLEVDGLNNISAIDGPCVFVSNHMSTLDPFALPSIIRPRKPVAFVVKESLMRVPFFGKILEARYSIPVSRTNPREDLKFVLEEGKKRIEAGISVAIFPQSTRSAVFNPEKFNSIGVKLARNNNIPIIPIALDTSAWSEGKLLKDFGPIKKHRIIRFSIGEAVNITGNGKEQQAYLCDFIGQKCNKWK